VTKKELAAVANGIKWAFTRGSAAVDANESCAEAFNTSHQNCVWNIWNGLECARAIPSECSLSWFEKKCNLYGRVKG
jgi:hypothetical protein